MVGAPDRLVVVTGGAGYLGSHVVRELLARGSRVRVLDALLFDDGLADAAADPRLEVVRGDIRNVVELLRAFRGAAAVLHLAAIVGDAACHVDPDVTWSVNVEATRLVVNVARRAGVRRLVLASSCSVYGASDDLVLNEGSLRRPVSLYAESRIGSEDICFRDAGLDLVVSALRMATLYGLSPRMRYDLVVNVMAARAAREERVPLYGGEQWRPLVHVADAARAFSLVLDAPEEIVHGQVFNVGSNDQNFRVREVAERVAAAIPGARVEPQPPSADDVRNYRVSFDKIQHHLGFAPERTVEQAADDIARFLREHPEVDFLADPYHNHRYPYAIDMRLPPRRRPRLRASDDEPAPAGVPGTS